MSVSLIQPTIKPITKSPKPLLTDKEIDEGVADAEMAQEMVSRTFRISPLNAEHILNTRNPHNRHLNPRTIERYVDVMSNGGWVTTSQGISFTENGELNNGQHRLRALIEAKLTIEFYVTFGEPSTAFEQIDSGRNRSVADKLSIEFNYPKSSYNDIAGVARALCTSQDNPPHGKKDYTTDELKPICKTFGLSGSELDPSLSMGRRIKSKFRHLSKHGVAAAYWIIEQQSPSANTRQTVYQSKRMDLIDAFFEGLISGANLGPKDARYVLREMIFEHDRELAKGNAGTIYSNDKHSQPVETMALVILAWNAFVRNQQLKKFRWDFSTGVFPTVV